MIAVLGTNGNPHVPNLKVRGITLVGNPNNVSK